MLRFPGRISIGTLPVCFDLYTNRVEHLWIPGTRSPARAAAMAQKSIKFKPKAKDTDWITEQRQGYIFAHFKKVMFSSLLLHIEFWQFTLGWDRAGPKKEYYWFFGPWKQRPPRPHREFDCRLGQMVGQYESKSGTYTSLSVTYRVSHRMNHTVWFIRYDSL